MAKFRIALIAHDQMKDRMVEWAEKHRAQLAQCDIVSTGTTGSRIIERCTQLLVGAHATGDHQALHAGFLQRLQAFRDQYLNDRIDEGASDVGLVLLA